MVRKLTFQSLCRIFSSQTIPKGKLQPWCRHFMTANGRWIRLVTRNCCSEHKTRGSTKNQSLVSDHGKQHFIIQWTWNLKKKILIQKALIYILFTSQKNTQFPEANNSLLQDYGFFPERKTKPAIIMCAWNVLLTNTQAICTSNYHCHFKRLISTLTYWHLQADNVRILFEAIPCYFIPNTTVLDF